MAYFGVNYFRPPFPISYPFVMTLFTVPLTIALLMLFGIALRLRALLPEWLARAADAARRAARRRARHRRALARLGMLAPLLVIALPSTPIFGGTKHWFTAYPFLCLFAGYAALHVIVSAESRLISRGWPRRGAGLASWPMALLLAPGFAETAHSHRFGLSHYTLAAGGVPGRGRLRHEPSVLGLHHRQRGRLPQAKDARRRHRVPQRHHLHGVRDAQARRPACRPTSAPRGDLTEADYVLVHHEHHFAEVDFQAWRRSAVCSRCTC